MPSAAGKQIKKFRGVVVSHATPKTAVVKINVVKTHPKYHKRYEVAKKYMVHDEKDEYKIGDKVEFIPCRPYSRRKKFIITSKIN